MILPVTPYKAEEMEEVERMPSKTYRFDRGGSRIIGMCDGLEAMVQTYEKMFDTERFAYPIYDDQYGVEFEELLGQNIDYVIAELESRIRDALFSDDRTLEIMSLEITQTGKDSVLVIGNISTTEGTVLLRKEVTV